jgi:hypothetical protein
MIKDHMVVVEGNCVPHRRVSIVQERKTVFYVLSLLTTAQSGTSEQGASQVSELEGATQGDARTHTKGSTHYHHQVGTAALKVGPVTCGVKLSKSTSWPRSKVKSGGTNRIQSPIQGGSTQILTRLVSTSRPRRPARDRPFICIIPAELRKASGASPLARKDPPRFAPAH